MDFSRHRGWGMLFLLCASCATAKNAAETEVAEYRPVASAEEMAGRWEGAYAINIAADSALPGMSAASLECGVIFEVNPAQDLLYMQIDIDMTNFLDALMTALGAAEAGKPVMWQMIFAQNASEGTVLTDDYHFLSQGAESAANFARDNDLFLNAAGTTLKLYSSDFGLGIGEVSAQEIILHKKP